MQKYLKRLNNSQNGYASFVIALVTIIVVSLIVVAFSADSRVEQKNTLSSNLATQAYYAAESGITDAQNVINYDVNVAKVTPVATNGCADASTPYVTGASNSLNGSVKYSCLIVNPTPATLQYQDVNPGQSQVVEIDNSNGHNIKTISFSWQDSGATSPAITSCPTPSATKADLPVLNAGSNPKLSEAGCDEGILQADIVSNGGLQSELNGLTPQARSTSKAYSLFMEPTKNSVANSSSIVAATAQDVVAPVYCSGGGKYICNYTIDVSSLADSVFYVRLESFYAPESIDISGTDAGGAINFVNGQVLIDSTGYANGQYKRIQESLCYGLYCSSSGNQAFGGTDAAIESKDCVYKHFSVYPGESPVPTIPANCP